jgi:hypothetical protein
MQSLKSFEKVAAFMNDFQLCTFTAFKKGRRIDSNILRATALISLAPDKQIPINGARFWREKDQSSLETLIRSFESML